MTKLAPIILFVWNRPWHTQKTVEALKRNDLAKDSNLFIFSDGPDAGGEERVKNVKKYLKTIKGFGKVTIIERENHLGLANSIIGGVTEIINDYGKVIVMEDDLVSSSSFLIYMNKLLDYYEKEKKIFGISGYNHPQSLMKIPSDYKADIYFNPRAGSWGWATWKDRWEKADWIVMDYADFRKNAKIRKCFNDGGEDMSEMLDAQMQGKIDSWAIRWSYAVFKNKGAYVYPANSYIDNIGMDGSGMHCGNSTNNIYKNNYLNGKKELGFPDKIIVDKRVMKNFRKVYKKSILKPYIAKLLLKILKNK